MDTITHIIIAAVVGSITALVVNVFGPYFVELWVKPKVDQKQKGKNCHEKLVKMLMGGEKGNEKCEEIVCSILSEYHMAWLYSDDEIVMRINQFLKSLSDTVKNTDIDSSEWHLGNAIIAMRRVNIPNTQLTVSDYLHLKRTNATVIGIMDYVVDWRRWNESKQEMG